MANPVGRPSRYDEDTIAKARYYLDNYKEYGDLFPSMAGMSLAIGVRRSTCYEWAKDEEKQEFSDIVDEMNAIQEKALYTNSLLGGYNASIAKLMLTKHGYSDKVETDLKSSDGSMTPTINVSFE